MADETETSRLIAEFSGVTDVDAERARLYLESAGWDLHLAISTFFDTMGGDDDDIGPAPTEQEEEAEENSDSDDEEGQTFYAGGSERSGQQILGPPRKKQTSDDVTQTGPSVKPQPVFKGAGYRLGDTAGESSLPLPETVSSTSSHSSPKQKQVVLKFWSNGFSVDDGPLRSFDDPANEQFLSSVRQGEIPQELLKVTQKGEVHLNIEDHRHEDYVPPPKPKREAFTGAGHRLGSPAPDVRFRHQPQQDLPAPASSQPAVAPSPVDDSKPVTSIQIRLADGTR
ncbi:NSFL1 cofactor p47 [Acropora cervicornis]|uniref:NSFL1 cofactor p47 n=1 Tax=Acropora cervicornis TaxID=6130 RepID=A0AAD9V9E8_ACRCE|nr:NSFL1 cofactor p47 [Acropora cervicornis]